MAVDLRAIPFSLDDGDIQWVESTREKMSLEEKIGQLFCFVGMQQSDEELIQDIDAFHVGGFMYRPEQSDRVMQKHRLLQTHSPIPLLLGANLEAGGSGVATDGTNYGKPLQCAATAREPEEAGYRLGMVATAEGAAVGCNWSFAPIVDLDLNYQNPITNLRSFGSDTERVYRMAKGYMKAAKENNVAPCIKHFPGDGVDNRDQHLHTTINSLPAEQWDATYGKVYQELIDAGAMSVMVGHIAQPNKARQLCPGISTEDAYMPASLSYTLMTKLLREELGFNGVVSTDSTSMLGMCVAMPRHLAVPTAIASGADVFLFTRNSAEDFGHMLNGYRNGIITEERLNDAVTRILGMKAALGLHKKAAEELVPAENKIAELGEKFKVWTEECADESITLVKNKENLLPISPAKMKRIYLNVLEENDSMQTPLRVKLKAMLEKEGFEVTVRDRDTSIDLEALLRGEMPPKLIAMLMEQKQSLAEWKSQYDLALYVANFETASNNVMVRIQWRGLAGGGNDYPWFIQEIPTIFASVANPYHLQDVPMMKTFINAYNSNDATLHALVDKLLGRSEFKGTSPVDPFCGMESTTL